MTPYDAFDDPYCYKGTSVLKNKAGLRDQAGLEGFELEMSSVRATEPAPTGKFDPAHYRALHRHLFQDVYSWAGKYRMVRTGKGGNAFCYPEFIEAEMQNLFGDLAHPSFSAGAPAAAFLQAVSKFLADLNAIHPFREGNGRTQLAFLVLLAERAGHRLDLTALRPKAFLKAMIVSFNGDNAPLTRELKRMVA